MHFLEKIIGKMLIENNHCGYFSVSYLLDLLNCRDIENSLGMFFFSNN